MKFSIDRVESAERIIVKAGQQQSEVFNIQSIAYARLQACGFYAGNDQVSGFPVAFPDFQLHGSLLQSSQSRYGDVNYFEKAFDESETEVAARTWAANRRIFQLTTAECSFVRAKLVFSGQIDANNDMLFLLLGYA